MPYVWHALLVEFSKMQSTFATKLEPDPGQEALLEATVRRFNAAADWLADVAFVCRCTGKYELQKRWYNDLRARFGLSAQMAVRCCARVAGALRRDLSIRPRFRPLAAVPYDARILSRKGEAVSILTLQGRIVVPFRSGQPHRALLDRRWAECDLQRRRDGRWLLLVTVEVPLGQGTLPREFLGVDLGVLNIAATSDGELFSGDTVERARRKYVERRRRLQLKAAAQKATGKRPKAIRRKLRAIAQKESLFRKDVNHCISKTLVGVAKDTGRGIALELLTHTRGRTRFRKRQRARMSGWSFSQLRSFVEYKAVLAGVLVSIVNPRNSSRQCFACKHVDKRSRDGERFACTACGHVAHADLNAAKNLSYRAEVSLPIVSMLVLLKWAYESSGTSLGLEAEAA